LTAGGFDLGDDFLVGGCGAGEQDYWVGLGELESYGPACYYVRSSSTRASGHGVTKTYLCQSPHQL
jgi:hypothetical protein